MFIYVIDLFQVSMPLLQQPHLPELNNVSPLYRFVFDPSYIVLLYCYIINSICCILSWQHRKNKQAEEELTTE
jgi:hypothetical protein